MLATSSSASSTSSLLARVTRWSRTTSPRTRRTLVLVATIVVLVTLLTLVASPLVSLESPPSDENAQVDDDDHVRYRRDHASDHATTRSSPSFFAWATRDTTRRTASSPSLGPASSQQPDAAPSPRRDTHITSSSSSPLDTLVVVAGHAVMHALTRAPASSASTTTTTTTTTAPPSACLNTTTMLTSPDCWFLESYQRDQLPTYMAHIRHGLTLLRDNPRALLLFSGGQTRARAGPISEGLSYFMAARAMNAESSDAALLSDADFDDRVTLEEYARDSFENLLFSVCRYHEWTGGSYPRRIVVIGFEFKRKRFVRLHRAAIRFPLDRFTYVGIDDPDGPALDDGDLNIDLSKASSARFGSRVYQGELRNSYQPFERNLYGCEESLEQKRWSRNPFHRVPSYGVAPLCPELAPLIDYCGEELFADELPWSPSIAA